MTAIYTYSTVLTQVTCGDCGISFAIPADLHAARLADGALFYCPNGHHIGWGDNELARTKRLKKQAEDRLAAVRAERDQIEASRRAWKGQATKLRNRTVAGECPFCGQHLRDLSRHIGRKHADEQSQDVTA